MKASKVILYVLASLVVICTMIYANYNGFSTVILNIKHEGGETMLYREITGPYSQTGEAITKIRYDLKNEFKIEPNKDFGMFFDSPRKVEKSKLRSDVGCILENSDTLRLFWLRAKFNIMICPVKDYITTEFPYKGKVSIMIGLMKVYPALMKYVKANGYDESGPVIEIYDIPNSKIIYRKEAIKKHI